MKRVFFSLFIVLLLLAGAFYFGKLMSPAAKKSLVLSTPLPIIPQIKINDATYLLEIADTAQLQQQGLSDRASLPIDHGMLFVFPQKSRQAFWMKDMHFALDMIWIDEDTIVDITENVPAPLSPNDKLPIYQPKVAVDKVLEINAGEVKRNRIYVGQVIKLSIIK